MKRYIVAGCVPFAILGCNLQGQARNPSFADAVAPPPTVAVAPVFCRGAKHGAAGDALDDQFSLLEKTFVKAPQVELDPEQHAAVCAAFGKVYGNDSFAIGTDNIKDWKATLTVATVLGQLAAPTGAKSVFLPVVASTTNCTKNAAVVRDSAGQQVAIVEDVQSTCTEGVGASAHAYLFTPDGQLLWKSWSMIRSGDPSAVENGVTALFTGVPADLTTPPPEPTPPPVEVAKVTAKASAKLAAKTGTPAAGFQPESIIDATLGATASASCKAYAKALCAKTSGPDSVRTKTCTAMLSSVKAVGATPRGDATCSALLKSISAAKSAP